MISTRDARFLKLDDLGNGLGSFPSAQIAKHHGPVLQGLGKSPLPIFGHALTDYVNSWKV